MKPTGYDFCGWATKNDLRCSDGRTIKRDAFAHQDGKRVPLVWNHVHDTPDSVCGYAILENRPEGVYTYAFCNDTPSGRQAKLCVAHGDVDSFSIYANHLKQDGFDVKHGDIKEVSLVYSGANPGALIEQATISHGKEVLEDELIIYSGEDLEMQDTSVYDEELQHEDSEERSVEDVLEDMSEEQLAVVDFLIGKAVAAALSQDSEEMSQSDEDEDEDDETLEHSEEDDEENYEENDEGEDEEMKKNVFDQETEYASNTLSHSDIEEIFKNGKRLGSLKEAYQEKCEELFHDDYDSDAAAGISRATGHSTYGINDMEMLFPDFKELNRVPEFIKRDTTWVAKVLARVHKLPMARVKTQFADITAPEARAKGYIKGNRKEEEVFTLLKRQTEPKTFYKKQKFDKDDLDDITDFDVLAWVKDEMRIMVDEEEARAILIGDGRSPSHPDKISETNIRPIWSDADLFTVRVNVDAGQDNSERAKNFIDAVIRSRKQYKGSGRPDLYTTEDMITDCLLLEDKIGHKLYKTEQELATTLRVGEIIPVEVMEGFQWTNPATGVTKDALGLIVNLTDYGVGSNNAGKTNFFDDFDIDYNQYKFLMERRKSGALTKPFSALAIESTPRPVDPSQD